MSRRVGKATPSPCGQVLPFRVGSARHPGAERLAAVLLGILSRAALATPTAEIVRLEGTGVFVAGYMYDTSGNSIWYVSLPTAPNPQSFQDTWLQFANGQPPLTRFRF